MPIHPDNSWEVQGQMSQQNPFSDPVVKRDDPFSDPTTESRDNPFADPDAAAQNNPFADPVDAASSNLPGASETQNGVKTSRASVRGESDENANVLDDTANELAGLAVTGDGQLGFGLGQDSLSNYDQQVTELVGQVAEPQAATSSFDWINPVYLFGLIPLLIIFMAWRWLVEDSELGTSSSRSKSRSRSRSTSRSSSSSPSRSESEPALTVGSTSLVSDQVGEKTTGVFRKVENFKTHPKRQSGKIAAKLESASKVDLAATLKEDHLLFGENKEAEFERLSA